MVAKASGSRRQWARRPRQNSRSLVSTSCAVPLAVAGRTNVEIGAELFLSPRTVEWHLGKALPSSASTRDVTFDKLWCEPSSPSSF